MLKAKELFSVVSSCLALIMSSQTKILKPSKETKSKGDESYRVLMSELMKNNNLKLH